MFLIKVANIEEQYHNTHHHTTQYTGAHWLLHATLNIGRWTDWPLPAIHTTTTTITTTTACTHTVPPPTPPPPPTQYTNHYNYTYIHHYHNHYKPATLTNAIQITTTTTITTTPHTHTTTTAHVWVHDKQFSHKSASHQRNCTLFTKQRSAFPFYLQWHTYVMCNIYIDK